MSERVRFLQFLCKLFNLFIFWLRTSHKRTRTIKFHNRLNHHDLPPLQHTYRFVTYQIIVSMASGFEFRGSYGYPSPFKEVMNALSGIFTFDVVGVLHVDCLGRTDFEHKLLASTLVPLGVFLLDAGYQLGRMMCFGGAFLDGKAFSNFIIFLYFTIPTTCMVIFSSFSCIEFEDDGDMVSYLRAE